MAKSVACPPGAVKRPVAQRTAAAGSGRTGYNRTLKLAIIGYGNVGRALVRLVRQKRQEFPFTIIGGHTLRHGAAGGPAGRPAEAREGAAFRTRAASVEEFLDAARAQVAIELTPLNPSTGEPA